MLKHVRIKNFQSLRDVDIDLAPLTVIVGKSNVGKSAFVRALKALAFNRRGTEWITVGEMDALIEAVTDRGIIALHRSRGKSPMANRYAVTVDGKTEDYTKLGGDVPDVVRGMLRVDEINFAGQFDKPYLLDVSLAETARVLGALTNIDVVLNASRESNRLRLADVATAKTLTAELSAAEAQVESFARLDELESAVADAERAIEESYTLAHKRDRLAKCVESIEMIVGRLKQLKTVGEVPDLGPALELHARLERILKIVAGVEQLRSRAAGLKAADAKAAEELAVAVAKLRSFLAEVGGDLEAVLVSGGVRDAKLATDLTLEWLDTP